MKLRLLILCMITLLGVGCSSSSSSDETEDPTAVEISSTMTSVLVGRDLELETSFAPTNADASLTWEIDDSSVGTIDTSGVVTGVSEGTTTVTVTVASDTSLTDLATVYVFASTASVTIESVSLESATASMTVGDTLSLSASVLPSYIFQDVEWESLDTGVVIVDSDGQMEAVATGVVSVRASSAYDETQYDTVVITVTEALNSITDVEVIEGLLESSLSGGDMDSAVNYAEAILVLDEDNTTANFIVGIDALVSVLDNDAVQDIVEDWESRLGMDLGIPDDSSSVFLSSSAAVDVMAIADGILTLNGYNEVLADNSDVIENDVLPIVEAGIRYFDRIIENGSFEFDLDRSFTGLNYDRDIDMGDAYLFSSGLNLVASVLYMSVAYDWGAADGTYTSAAQVFSENESFGTLKENGEAHMQAAFETMSKSLTYIIDGYEFIYAETDDQSDDVFTSSYLEHMSFVVDVENGVLTVTSGEYETETNQYQTLLDGGTVYQTITYDNGQTHQVAVNLANFFNSPVQDVRDYLGINVSDEITESAFPSGYDFTLNGLFPELDSYADWEAINLDGYTFFIPGSVYSDIIWTIDEWAVSGTDVYYVRDNYYSFYLIKADVSDPDNVTFEEVVELTYTWKGTSLDVSGGYVYVSDGDGLKVVDVDSQSIVDSDLSSSVENANGVVVVGDVLCVLKDSNIYTYDISDPTNISQLSVLSDQGWLRAAEVDGSVLYVQDYYYDEIRAFEVGADGELTLFLTISDVDNATKLVVEDGYIYVNTYENIHIYGTDGTFYSTFEDSNAHHYASFDVMGSTMIMTDPYMRDGNFFSIKRYDVSNPLSPELVETYTSVLNYIPFQYTSDTVILNGDTVFTRVMDTFITKRLD